jgi:hypothetical protein
MTIVKIESTGTLPLTVRKACDSPGRVSVTVAIPG